MNVSYSITEHNTVQVLSINSLLDEWQNRQILKELQYKIDQGANEFVVDLAPLSLVNSVGLNFLLSLFSKTKQKGGALVLANVSKRVQRILDITKLSAVFTVCPTVEKAVDNFSLQLAV
ncbi:MAG: STAS domain-containing protein [Saprospiraceae bacterium]